MTISQQTTSLLDTTREAGLDEYAEAMLAVQDASQFLQRDPTTGRNGIKEDIAEMIPMQVVQENRARKNLPGARLQKVAFEEL